MPFIPNGIIFYSSIDTVGIAASDNSIIIFGASL